MLNFKEWYEMMSEEASAVTGDVEKTDKPLMPCKDKKKKDCQCDGDCSLEDCDCKDK